MKNNMYREFMGENVSLKDYDVNFPVGSVRDTLFPKGKWKQWKWVFIGDWKIDDPRLSNLGVRAEQNATTASDEMAYDFLINGWKTNFFPPVIDTEGNVRGGRTRIIAAIKKKQQWIPFAEYHFEETDAPVRDKLTAGLLENSLHSPLTRIVTEDYIVAGIAMIDAGDMKRDKDEIMQWLVDEANVGARFPNESSNGGGVYTRIVNDIYKRTADVANLTRVLGREDWLEWLEKTTVAGNYDLLYKAGKKQTDAKLIWCDHVLPHIENEREAHIEREGKWQIKNPTRIVIYTDKLTAEDSSSYVEGLVKDLDDLYTKSYSLINSVIGNMLDKKCPNVKPFEIVGVCPNLYRGGQDKMFENYLLVDLDEYILAGCPISNALKLVA